MSVFTKLLGRLDVSKLSFKKKKEEKPSLLKDVMNNPEAFKLEAFIENEEIIVKIKKKEEES